MLHKCFAANGVVVLFARHIISSSRFDSRQQLQLHNSWNDENQPKDDARDLEQFRLLAIG